MKYKNTQTGYFTIAAFLLVILVTGVLYLSAPLEDAEKNILASFLILFTVLLISFSSLTVKITREELIWYFGPGIWKYRIKLTDIQTVAAIRTHPAEGFGIRWWPGKGILYNVSGLKAIKVMRNNGKIRRIGTNEPQKLVQALQEAASLPDDRVLK